ncbi:hypothetical protein [Limnoglobus roseus]|uniref:Uncharacterized protein n=1 Tax=Limnoglobus roseus TaxID=2598579 RepID=A0A5C1AEY6_9BACT|nr:hypothetical protein [Limnoglobus roseus]QEL17105.1 hypothetical protein PX52LOC_04082 [Limnoglobus roseus]
MTAIPLTHADRDLIDFIMDGFHFRTVFHYLEHAGVKWGDGELAAHPTEPQLRLRARALLTECCRSGPQAFASGNGFVAVRKSPTELELHFSITSCGAVNDGTDNDSQAL